MRIAHLHSEKEASKCIRNGDEQGFNRVFHQYYGPLTYFAQSILNDQETAEDIVEDTFVKLWERPEILFKPGSLKSYLYTTVRNASIDYLRKVKRLKAYSSEVKTIKDVEEKPVLHSIIEAETMHMIYQALETLPPKCGQIFKMFYLEGKKLEEIATELNIALSTVKSQKGRAIQLLQKRLPELLLLFTLFHFIY